MNIYLVARKSCSDAFWKEVNIGRLKPQPIKLGGPPNNDVQFVNSKGWAKNV